MTEYYIHGGLAFNKSKSNKIFFEGFLDEYKIGDLILFIPFAKDNYYEIFSVFKDIVKFNTGKECIFELGIDNKEELLKQINKSKFIYISGGDYKKLYSSLKFLEKYKDIFKGKKVIVSSAGTNLLAKYSYANDYKEIQKGINFLDILTYCHYSCDNKGKKMLEELNTKLPIYLLGEGEFVRIDI